METDFVKFVYIPDWHWVHMDAEIVTLYDPMSQLMHAEAPDVEMYVPATQSIQLACLIKALNFPGPHIMQEVVPVKAV